MNVHALFADMVKQNGSDLFMSVGARPFMKVEGHMVAQEAYPVMDSQLIRTTLFGLLNDEQKKKFETANELNIAIKIPDVGRFRMNLFVQQGEPAMVARHVKTVVPPIDQLGLPEIIKRLSLLERGLVLVVGATGSGKSTSLASMIDYRNTNKPGHILTIEDPIEFIHVHKKSLVNQREVGLDTNSYEIALANALRESPDVILIGEIRDIDTMKHAISFAETGHLCFSTLHASNANQAIERIIGFFPDTSQKQLLADLSQHLKAVISQRLAKGVNGKRVAIIEVMLITPFVSDLIASGRLHEIKDAMLRDVTSGTQTFDVQLYKAVDDGKITKEEALRLADNVNEMKLKFRLDAPKVTTAPPPAFPTL